MLLELNLGAEVPIYQQIRNQIVQGIANGALHPGECLPSVRQLAADIGINLHTVNKAYQLLKQEGFVDLHRQKGAIVRELGKIGSYEGYLPALQEALLPIIAEAVCRGITQNEFKKICTEIWQKSGGNV